MFKTLCRNIKIKVIKFVYLRRWKECPDRQEISGQTASSDLWDRDKFCWGGQRLPHGTLWPPPPWSATSLLHLNTLHQGGVPANTGQGLWITWTWELCPETRHKSLLHLKRFSGFLKTVWKPWRAVASDISKHWNPLRTLLLVQAPTSGLDGPDRHFNSSPCDSEAGAPGLHLEVPASASSTRNSDWQYEALASSHVVRNLLQLDIAGSSLCLCPFALASHGELWLFTLEGIWLCPCHHMKGLPPTG